MNDLYIYAFPAQMIIFHTVTSDGKIITNDTSSFTDVVRITSKHLKTENINKIYIIGETVFADKVAEIINKNLNVLVERIKN